MKRLAMKVFFLIAGVHCLSSTALADEDNVMVIYACAAKEVKLQLGTPVALNEDGGLTPESIQALAENVPPNLRRALIDGAKGTVAELKKHHAKGAAWTPADFFDRFISRVDTRLPRFIAVKGCGRHEMVHDAIYGESINRYFSTAIGKGAMYCWFKDHGGLGTYTANVAAMVALQLSGYPVDVDSWKGFYIREQQRRASEAEQS